MDTCLITGGAGFIGSHLTEECLERGCRVIVLDNLSTGKKANLPIGHERLTFIEGDITDRRTLRAVRKDFPAAGYLFHLAAIASVTQSIEDPDATHRVNFDGTLMLLETFRDAGLNKFVYASSAAVYGAAASVPVREDCLPAPISPYGADKLSGEHYLTVYNHIHGLPTVSCRFFNVFGERQDPSSDYSGVISIFFDRVAAAKHGAATELAIYGDGGQSRDFIYVKDIVRALLFLAKQNGTGGAVFNIAYGGKITIRDLAQKIKQLADVAIATRFHRERPGDVRHSQADISKLLKAGFAFRYSFEKGLTSLAGSLLE